jgi:uroporphyrinogen-III synthase
MFSADAEDAGRSTRPRIVTTRDTPGRLDALLTQTGAEVVHVPLIAIGEAPDGGRSLAAELARLDRYQWLIVTSRHGASRVGAAAADHQTVRLAVVGTSTAERLEQLAGREVSVVPSVQTAAGLCEAMPVAVGRPRALVVQADRADSVLMTGLEAKGFDVTTVIGYSTRLRRPTSDERRIALSADAVVFASGSAARSWAEAFGAATPPVVVVIGPTTRRVAQDAGLKVTHMSSDHSIEGLVAEISSVFRWRP